MRLARSLRPRGSRVGRVSAIALLVLAARALSAQAIGQAFELERVGQAAQAAAIYFAALRAEPTNLSALLGLERVLPGLGRLPELLPVAQRATAASPTNVAVRSVLLRTYVGLNEPDSARAVAQRWIAAAPRDEAPYREWAMALEDQRRHEAARAVLVDGRRALREPAAFGIELAELAERSGEWEGAAREWAAALSGAPAQLPYAASELGAAPPSQRDRIAQVLTVGDPPPLTRRLAGELLLNWGQAERAWAVYAPSLATASADAAVAARHFADLAAARTTPAARRVRALALARYAELASGPVAARARTEAARALLDMGDRVAARSVLESVARDSAAPADAQALAQTTLVAALIDAGQLDEAAQRLARADRLAEEDRATLRRRLARGRIAQGDLDRADASLARDSSVEALAVKGWIALYRGRLQDAAQLFAAAGPYAGDRRDATARTEMLALLERVAADSFAELGGALLTLARGDSAKGAAALHHAANQPLAGASGRPDILLLAARVDARLGPGEQQIALALFAEVVRTAGSGAPAPAAELEWARLLERRLEPAAAIQHLEHLILSYPGSAVIPEARRELDRAKGAIPKS
jgi:tetratricopeptide (TPR) repeat protein